MKKCILKCPRKIRDNEQRDVNEFFEWRFEKVSNCWLRSAGSNYDTRLKTILKTCLNYIKINKKMVKNFDICLNTFFVF